MFFDVLIFAIFVMIMSSVIATVAVNCEQKGLKNANQMQIMFSKCFYSNFFTELFF